MNTIKFILDRIFIIIIFRGTENLRIVIGVKFINSLDILTELINEEWNNINITFAEPWEIPWVVPPGERDDYEIHFLEKGKGWFYVGDREYYMNQGDIIWLHSMEGNSFRPDGAPFRLVFVTFNINNHKNCGKIEKLNNSFKEENFPFRIGETSNIQEIFHQMHREMSIQSCEHTLRVKLLLGTIILKIKDMGKQHDNVKNVRYTVNMGTRELINRVFVFLQDNYNREIKLEEIGRTFNLHPRYLCTVFRQISGKTTSEFLREIRLEKAKRLLLYTQLSITEIALEVGFSNSQYFSRVFSQVEGMEPSSFRKARRQLKL